MMAGMTSPRRTLTVCLALSAAAVLTACGGTRGIAEITGTAVPEESSTAIPHTNAPSEVDGSPAPPPPEATATVDPQQPTDGTQQQSDPAFPDPPKDSDITVESVEVEGSSVIFSGSGSGSPGYAVQYVDEAFDPSTGEPVSVDAPHVLQVIVTGVTADSAPAVATGAGGPVKGIVTGSVTPPMATFFIGTDQRVPFTVATDGQDLTVTFQG